MKLNKKEDQLLDEELNGVLPDPESSEDRDTVLCIVGEVTGLLFYLDSFLSGFLKSLVASSVRDGLTERGRCRRVS